MPQIEEIGAYLRGVWLLILGDRSGFDWLDITVTGVWRSFAAFLWCLPAMAVGWAAWRLFYLEQMPTGTETGLGFILKLFLVDMTMWIVPLVLVAVLAKPLGYGDMLASIIISTNWLAVPTVYAMAVPLAIRLVIPGGQGLAYLMSLILLLVKFHGDFPAGQNRNQQPASARLGDLSPFDPAVADAERSLAAAARPDAGLSGAAISGTRPSNRPA